MYGLLADERTTERARHPKAVEAGWRALPKLQVDARSSEKGNGAHVLQSPMHDCRHVLVAVPASGPNIATALLNPGIAPIP